MKPTPLTIGLLAGVAAFILMSNLAFAADTGGAGNATARPPLWLESDGVVVMEAEQTVSPLDKWIKITPGGSNFVAGATGSGHLEFTANTHNGGKATSPLEYHFKINEGGVYRLFIRARKRLEGLPGDKCNDGYVRVSGHFTAGGGTPLELLQQDTKFFGGDAENWGWAAKLDADHKKLDADYEFKAGETYTLVLSGRSIRWNVDRIVLRKAGTPDSTWQNAPESPRAP
jgi:hypothetical protein